MKVRDKQQWTHRGQRQAKVGGLVFHLDLNLMEESLDSFLLKAIPVLDDKYKWLLLTVEIVSCFFMLAHLMGYSYNSEWRN